MVAVTKDLKLHLMRLLVQVTNVQILYLSLHYDSEDGDIPLSECVTDLPGEVEVDSDDDNIPLSKLVTGAAQNSSNPRKKIKTDKEPEPIWSEDIINLMEMNETNGYNERLNDVKESTHNETPVETFERLFDKEIFKIIVGQSMLYAAQKNDHTFSLTEDEIKVFLGILMFSGYHKLPRAFSIKPLTTTGSLSREKNGGGQFLPIW